MMSLETVSIAVAFLATIVSVASVFVALRRRKIQLNIREEDKPDKRKGLIALIGPMKGTAPAAIEYHFPTLRHCWLVGTNESLSTAQQLAKDYEEVIFYWGELYLVSPDEIRDTYN